MKTPAETRALRKIYNARSIAKRKRIAAHFKTPPPFANWVDIALIFREAAQLPAVSANPQNRASERH